jgi:L-methionine (R)-S-oxide reductase
MKIDELLEEKSIDYEKLLGSVLQEFGCSTGTIHILDIPSGVLHLKAHQGVPAFLIPKMAEVPIGKGMAGIAAQRKEAVQVCNLQTDESGVVRPGAKDTKVEGAITVPLLSKGELYGTLGIAKKEPYEFSQEESEALMEIGRKLAERVRKKAL